MPKIKFPVLKNVEYGSIVKGGKSILEMDGSEIEGKSWREFQIFLGEKLPPGKYPFTIKFKKNDTTYSGQIRAVNMNETIKDNSDSQSEVIKAFKSLENKISNATSTGGITFEILLQSTKQGYESQVNFLNQQIVYKDNRITKLENELDELESELDEAEEIIKDLKDKTGFKQYIEIGEKLLTAKFSPGKAVSLKDSDTSDIPNELLEVLGVVDWSKIDTQSLQKIIGTLKQYISLLPQKGIE